MIARPAFSTCPVKTLLIFLENEIIQKEQLKVVNFQDVIKMQMSNEFPDIVYQEKNESYEYLEFQPEFLQKQKSKYNPTLCVQFLKTNKGSIQLYLNMKRRCRYCYVILVDIEDRRHIWNMNPDIGLDVSFVVFGGYVVNF